MNNNNYRIEEIEMVQDVPGTRTKVHDLRDPSKQSKPIEPNIELCRETPIIVDERPDVVDMIQVSVDSMKKMPIQILKTQEILKEKLQELRNQAQDEITFWNTKPDFNDIRQLRIGAAQIIAGSFSGFVGSAVYIQQVPNITLASAMAIGLGSNAVGMGAGYVVAHIGCKFIQRDKKIEACVANEKYKIENNNFAGLVFQYDQSPPRNQSVSQIDSIAYGTCDTNMSMLDRDGADVYQDSAGQKDHANSHHANALVTRRESNQNTQYRL